MMILKTLRPSETLLNLLKIFNKNAVLHFLKPHLHKKIRSYFKERIIFYVLFYATVSETKSASKHEHET